MAAVERSRGFTLLELLVVLVLVAAVTGLVAPRASNWLDATQARGWRSDLRAHIAALPVKAFLAGESLRVDAAELQARLPAPVEWGVLHLDAPLQYSAMGAATGGRVELRRGSTREVWVVQPVTGELVDVDGQ